MAFASSVNGSPGGLEPPPAAGLFQVTLASSDLHAYLRRLAAELENQSRICSKVVEDVAAMKTEFALLSRTTMRMNEEHGARVATLQNAIGSTANQAQLRAVNVNLQRQINSIAKLLEVNLDEEANDEQSAVGQRDDDLVNNSDIPISAVIPVGSGMCQDPPAASSLITVGEVPVLKHQAPLHVDAVPPPQPVSPGSPSLLSPRAVQPGAGSNGNYRQQPSSSLPSTRAGAIPSPSVPSSTGAAGGGGGLRGVVDKCIQEWYKSRGLIDAKIRHEITISTLKGMMGELESSLREEFKGIAAELVSISYYHESRDAQKAETMRHIGSISGEVDRQRKSQLQFEGQVRSVVMENVRKVIRGTQRANRRINRFYEMMSLPEPEDEEDEESCAGYYNDEDAEGYEERALRSLAGVGTGDAPPANQQVATGIATQQVVANSTTPLPHQRHSVVSIASPPSVVSTDAGGDNRAPDVVVDGNDPTAKILGVPIPVTRKATRGASSMGSAMGGLRNTNSFGADNGRKSTGFTNRTGARSAMKSRDGSIAEDGVDVRTNSVIQSPVFVAFRQHVLNDISERIAAARSTQSSDIDIELLAMRNDIRQRVTSTRVVELIKQYSDTDTPQRVTALARRVAELGDEKVSIPDLNDGLRSKADVHILDVKANVEYVDRVCKDLRERQEALQSDLGLLISDRREYRDVVQQLLIQQQRLQASIGSGGTGSSGAGVASAARGAGLLPAINPNGVVAASSLSESGRVAAGRGGSSSVGGAGNTSGYDQVSLMATDGGAAADEIGGGGSPHLKAALRTAADSTGYAPRPLTELISPRTVGGGGVMPGSVLHAPSPPLPMLHKPQPPVGAVGLTSSQAAYTAKVNDTPSVPSNTSGVGSPVSGRAAALAAARSEVESKAPLPYKKGGVASPSRR